MKYDNRFAHGNLPGILEDQKVNETFIEGGNETLNPDQTALMNQIALSSPDKTIIPDSLASLGPIRV